jgi:hypothetical protein
VIARGRRGAIDESQLVARPCPLDGSLHVPSLLCCKVDGGSVQGAARPRGSDHADTGGSGSKDLDGWLSVDVYDVLVVYEALDDRITANVAMAVAAAGESSRPRPRDCSAGRNDSSLCANPGLSAPGKRASRNDRVANCRSSYRAAADPQVQLGQAFLTVPHQARQPIRSCRGQRGVLWAWRETFRTRMISRRSPTLPAGDGTDGAQVAPRLGPRWRRACRCLPDRRYRPRQQDRARAGAMVHPAALGRCGHHQGGRHDGGRCGPWPDPAQRCSAPR